MTIIDDLIKRLEAFDPAATILKSAHDNQDSIISSVTDIQLYFLGETGDETFIWDYAPYSEWTMEEKIEKGHPWDRVTLRDTGDFHDSFQVKIDKEQFEITATDWKTDELIGKYGEAIMALNDPHLRGIAQKYFLVDLKHELRRAING